MTLSNDARRGRVRRYIERVRRLRAPDDPLGERARRELPAVTGLSAAGVELALRQYLELDPSAEELELLCASTPEAERVHVLLSANVFVAAHRAVAVALAASEHVFVRPSRREPVMARLLQEASSAFQLVPELAPAPGDHLYVYGSAETIAAVRSTLPSGVTLHAHGPGIGIAVIDLGPGSTASAAEQAARDLAPDVIVFDQRGCLSPRIALVLGERAAARRFAAALAEELAAWEARVPCGRAPELDAERRRFRDAALYAGEVFAAGTAWVSLDVSGAAPLVPPAGRNFHVRHTPDLLAALAPLAPLVTTVGLRGGRALRDAVATTLPSARRAELGSMQKPPLDGVVDRRGG